MQRFHFIKIICIAFFLFAVGSFSACKPKNPQTPAQSSSQTSETPDSAPDSSAEQAVSTAIFATLTLQDGKAETEVSNATEYFSFADEITTSGTQIEVYTDDAHTIRTSLTVRLEAGDNAFYLLEKAEGQAVASFTITIRRRPLYEVRFDANGGEEIPVQTVEENGLASAPTPTRAGYTFTAWDYDFTTPITQDILITASWQANTDTPYAVEYYLQNAENDEYALFLREEFTGTTDTLAYAEIKNFEHFTPIAQGVTGNIEGNGKSALKVYYTRNEYEVVFDGAGGVLQSGEEVQKVRYQGAAIPPVYAKNGYENIGFDKPLHGICENATITVVWQIKRYAITYILNGAVNSQNNPVFYTVETPTFSLHAPMGALNGYDGGFLEWQSEGTRVTEIPQGSFGDIVLIAKGEKPIFKSNEGCITGLTAYGKTLTDICVPTSLDGVEITAIGENAFKKNENLERLTLPQTITKIGAWAFYQCVSLQRLDIPKGVTRIEAWSFAYCKSVKEISLPENVTHIGEMAFNQCENLTELHIGDKLQVIEKWAFNLCRKLTKITFAGTRQAWKSITKDLEWDGQIPAEYVDCKDGAWKIPKE